MRVNVGVYNGCDLLEVLSFDTCGLSGEAKDRYINHAIRVIDEGMLPNMAKRLGVNNYDLKVQRLGNEINNVILRPKRPKILKK